MTEPRRGAWIALAAGLAMTCAVFAQDAQPSQGEEQPGADERGRDLAGEKPQQPPAPTPEGGPAPQEGSSPLRRAWSQIRGGQGEQDAARPEQGGVAPRRLEVPPEAPERPGNVTELTAPAPEDVFTIETVGEPVQIGSLVDWVSKRLNINIFSDPGVADRTVTFNGPMRIRADELLDFLSLLVEQQGFALTREREGWYVIRPAGQVAFNLGDGALATTRIIPTPLLRPTALKVAVDAALSSRGASDGAASNRIAYIDELGIIIITDTPRGLRSVEEIVKAVIAEARSQSFHRIEVAHINAELARAKVIELNGAQAMGSRQAQRGNNQPIGQPAVASPTTASLTNLPDRIFLDSESNALIFRGTASEAAELGTLVMAIDTPSRLIPKRYPAGPASPAICAYGERRGLGTVTSGPSTGGSQFGQSGSFNNRGFAGAGLQQQQGSASGSGFVLEDNQEAFVYFGTAEQHEQVAALVESFADQARLARVVVEFYPLRHADAEEVAELLNAIVQDTTQQFGQSPFLPQGAGARRVTQTTPDAEGGATVTTVEGDGVGVSLTPSENISIQGDISRNQIVIKAPIRQQAEFASIISQLDIRQPQVFIEAKVVSVDTDDDFQFGVDWRAAIDTSVGAINLFSNFGLINNIPTPAGVGPTAIGVVDGTDVDVVLNALSTVGETRILSTPRILVRDNGEAELNSTREEPYATTTQNAGTAVTGQGGTAEAGTKLTVKPQISAGGLVNLDVQIELSSFVGQGSDGLQPPKQKETYSTIVSLPSDSTLIIGGLTFDRKRDEVEKVPLLGDIPIIGQAFRNTTMTRRRTTVFVFIRPVILRDESMTDLRLLTRGPIKEAGIEGDTPDLEPERIPIRSGSLGSSSDRPVRLGRRDDDPS
ncbi:MAG: hypothetical protein IBJ10_04225 [Phycisphaerales bacterium]|nr:hypothetical protein [Phycisphaerales bacterium]